MIHVFILILTFNKNAFSILFSFPIRKANIEEMLTGKKNYVREKPVLYHYS